MQTTTHHHVGSRRGGLAPGAAAKSLWFPHTFLQNTSMKSKDVEKVAGNYVDFFDASKGNTEKERKEHYETVVNSYYDLATDFYEYGWGQSFHFATQAKGEAYTQAIARHEHWLALQLQLKKDDLVLVRFYGSLTSSRQGLWLRCWWTGA